MRGLRQQLATSLRLYGRNRMALLYGYLFPVVFLVAFHVLYLHDRIPLIRHMGELLTVTVLGGACFGLATTLVSERERGVWRRFKLVPVSTGLLVASTVFARYLLLLSAGLLQLLLARALGMPWPAHPFDLFVAFTLASFAFLGVGLVLAMLADTVPAVQALGQSVFLPMLILGGVAVPITALPDWARQVSAFFPGRYAVEALQSSVNGGGLEQVRFALVALVVIGLAACVAAGRMFRWDAQQRFAAGRGRAWLVLALASWIVVGAYAVNSGYAELLLEGEVPQESAPPVTAASPVAGVPPVATPDVPTRNDANGTNTPVIPPSPEEARAVQTPPPAPAAAFPPADPAPKVPPAETPAAAPAPSDSAAWRAVRLGQIDDELVFSRLPPDSGVVTPVASERDQLDDNTAFELSGFQEQLHAWAPGKIADPVQRVRNLLYVAGVIDVFQMATESYVPLYVFEEIQQGIPERDDLLRILYWIAVHPEEGTDSAVDEMQSLGIPNGPSQVDDVRNRAAIYAVKLIGRLTGKRPAR